MSRYRSVYVGKQSKVMYNVAPGDAKPIVLELSEDHYSVLLALDKDEARDLIKELQTAVKAVPDVPKPKAKTKATKTKNKKKKKSVAKV